jgi:RNA polymerase sigma-70 factor, ECF subfamily
VDAFLTIRLPGLAAAAEAETERKTSAQSVVATTEPSDEALMECLGTGDQTALSSLFRRYARLVRGVAYRILRDPSEADDLLQDVFLFIHRKSALFDPSKGSARSWIVQVTYHRAIDRRRYLLSRHFYTRVDLEDVIREQRDPALGDVLGAIVDRADAQKLFESLSENQRQTLTLFFFEGCTFDEISLKLGQTRGNIKNHYFRGLEKLRKLLQCVPQRNSAV